MDRKLESILTLMTPHRLHKTLNYCVVVQKINDVSIYVRLQHVQSHQLLILNYAGIIVLVCWLQLIFH